MAITQKGESMSRLHILILGLLGLLEPGDLSDDDDDDDDDTEM